LIVRFKGQHPGHIPKNSFVCRPRSRKTLIQSVRTITPGRCLRAVYELSTSTGHGAREGTSPAAPPETGSHMRSTPLHLCQSEAKNRTRSTVSWASRVCPEVHQAPTFLMECHDSPRLSFWSYTSSSNPKSKFPQKNKEKKYISRRSAPSAKRTTYVHDITGKKECLSVM